MIGLLNGFVNAEGKKMRTQFYSTFGAKDLEEFYQSILKTENETLTRAKIVYGFLGVITAALPFCIFAALI